MQRRVSIQHCRDCKKHSWNTRHNESRYVNCYMELKNCLQKNNIQVRQNLDYRLGSFQVHIQNYQIFSKLKSGLFPNIEAVTKFILQFFQNISKNKEKYNHLIKNIQRNVNLDRNITLSPGKARLSQFCSPNKYASSLIKVFDATKQIENSRVCGQMSISTYTNLNLTGRNLYKSGKRWRQQQRMNKTLYNDNKNPELQRLEQNGSKYVQQGNKEINKKEVQNDKVQNDKVSNDLINKQ